jgi:hypothetical protein
MCEFAVAEEPSNELQSLELGETPDLYDRFIGWRRLQPDRSDVTEKVDSDEIQQPLWRPWFSSRNFIPVAPLPVILDHASCLSNRRNRVPLGVSAS